MVPVDDFLNAAQTLLGHSPVFDGHNDLPWLILRDAQARGDVRTYDLMRERGDTDIPRLREGRVGAQFWSAFQPTTAQGRRARSRPTSWSRAAWGWKTRSPPCASGTRRGREC